MSQWHSVSEKTNELLISHYFRSLAYKSVVVVIYLEPVGFLEAGQIIDTVSFQT